MELGITLKDAIEKESQIRDRIKKEEEVKELFDLALKLRGFNQKREYACRWRINCA